MVGGNLAAVRSLQGDVAVPPHLSLSLTAEPLGNARPLFGSLPERERWSLPPLHGSTAPAAAKHESEKDEPAALAMKRGRGRPKGAANKRKGSAGSEKKESADAAAAAVDAAGGARPASGRG